MSTAESLFEKYRLECGLDDEDVKAARWYKHGLIEFADWILGQNMERPAVSRPMPFPTDDEIKKAAPCCPDGGKMDVQAHAWFVVGAKWCRVEVSNTVMDCFDYKIKEIQKSIEFDDKVFKGRNKELLTGRAEAIKDMRKFIEACLNNSYTPK